MFAASITAACQKEEQKSVRNEIGHHVTQLAIRVGSVWGNGYRVIVAPEEYALIESIKCPNAKRAGVPAEDAYGFCVVRISPDQSKRFEAAMEPFKRYSKPVQTFSFDDDFARPDGRPCKSKWTDATLITLTWSGTEGVRMASFYTGCDREELNDLYESALRVTDPLPIQQFIKPR